MPPERDPRLSLQGLKVLAAFLDSHGQELSGADIRQVIRVATGTLYPLLLRFEDAGWLISRWEEVDPSEAGRPRRRLYALTGLGRAKAMAALSAVREGQQGAVAWI